MINKNLILISVILMFAASACTRYEYNPYNAGGITPTINGTVGPLSGTDSGNTSSTPDNQINAEENNSQGDINAEYSAIEGDKIILQPNVTEADGDTLVLTFSKPFDDNGEWQTQIGDAGLYSVNITASDGKGAVSKIVTVLVKPKNNAPVIDMPDSLSFKEGEQINLEPKITDPDGDNVAVTYSGWMTGNPYTATYSDAGEHNVTVTADDGTVRTTKLVRITVENVNRAPLLKISNADSNAITVKEGDLVKLDVESADPDGDKVEIKFPEPFNEKGEWQTKEGDAGVKTYTVSASDGEKESTQDVLVTVESRNQAPVIEDVKVVPSTDLQLETKDSSITVKLETITSDPNGDNVTVTYSGWMDSDTKTVAWGTEGGEHTVTVTASDGKLSTTKDITFKVNSWPVFD